jgi:hypothetical protein
MNRPALLMVSMEPPPSLEEEFHDWYDTEHLPQRRALPGFVSATRWTCVHGWPRWLALYELDAIAAVQSDAYRAVSGSNSTPWSRRLLPRTVGRLRVVAEAMDGDRVTLDERRASRLVVVGVEAAANLAVAAASALRASLSTCDALVSSAVFVEAAAQRLWLLATFDAPLGADAVAERPGRPAGCAVSSFNVYVPYRRSNY